MVRRMLANSCTFRGQNPGKWLPLGDLDNRVSVPTTVGAAQPDEPRKAGCRSVPGPCRIRLQNEFPGQPLCLLALLF